MYRISSNYSQGIKLNPGQLTHPNWKILSLNFTPLSIWTRVIMDHEIN